jgi:hypothetical protein
VSWVAGFGSCHSFGVAVGLCGYGMCQMRGAIRSTIFLKMRRVGCFSLSLSRVLIFSKSKLSAKPFTCPRGKSLLENCRPFFLKHKFVRTLLLPTTRVYDGCGFRSCVLSHVPKRNIKTKLQINTSPAAGINTRLGAGRPT